MSRRVAAANGPTAFPTIQEMEQVASQHGATVVEYSIAFDEELFIWVVKPTHEIALRRVDLRASLKHYGSLDELVATSREAVGARGRGFPVEASAEMPEKFSALRELHQLLIEPIADLLPKTPDQRVVFVPNGALFLHSDGRSMARRVHHHKMQIWLFSVKDRLGTGR